MKNFMKQLLILGGFYFVISFFIPSYENTLLQLFELFLLTVFVLFVLVLCFKKKYVWIEKVQLKFPRVSNFLTALGFVEYFSIFFFMIPGAVYGYNAAMAEYNGTEYNSVLPQYLYYGLFVYFAVLIISLLWAAYKSFIAKTVRQ